MFFNLTAISDTASNTVASGPERVWTMESVLDFRMSATVVIGILLRATKRGTADAARRQCAPDAPQHQGLHNVGAATPTAARPGGRRPNRPEPRSA